MSSAEYICAFCHETADSKLIKPCDCDKRVHVQCLSKHQCHVCLDCDKQYVELTKSTDRRRIVYDVAIVLSIIWNIFNAVGFLGYDYLPKIEKIIFISMFLFAGLVGSIGINLMSYGAFYIDVPSMTLYKGFTAELTISHIVVAIVVSIFVGRPMFCIFTFAITFTAMTIINFLVGFSIIIYGKIFPNGICSRYRKTTYGDRP